MGVDVFHKYQQAIKITETCSTYHTPCRFDTPSSAVLQELGWLSVNARIKYNKAVLTYKALNKMTPEYITQL